MKRSYLVLLAVLCACGGNTDSDTDTGETTATTTPAVASAPALDINVVRRIAHDPAAYTQGLVFHNGRLFESAGRYDESTIREIDPQTGTVLRSVKLPKNVFGEGLAAVGDELVQITWKELIAYRYDLNLKGKGTYSYQGDGWGLCDDGTQLFMTSGSDDLIRRNRSTFAPLGTTKITLNGETVFNANELECVGGDIWANVYPTDRILRIDKTDATVIAEANASALRADLGIPNDPDHALNGIAYNPATKTYFITGKLWPAMFEVTFAPRDTARNGGSNE